MVRAEAIEWKPWWPRWISIDWGFEHPAAAYWHSAAAGSVASKIDCADAVVASCRDPRRADTWGTGPSFLRTGKSACATESAQPTPKSMVVTYRELVTHRTAPRDLAREIVERSRAFDGSREKIEAIYLSPDAFARRTDEASIAEQMGDVFAAAGIPRPIPADNDRVGGWMLMYQMLDAGEWLLTENCIELIRTIPNLVRDMARVEDVEKMDGDDAADAARYGLKSRYGSHAATFVERLPYEARLAARAVSADPTVRAIQARKAQIEESRRSLPVSFLRRRR